MLSLALFPVLLLAGTSVAALGQRAITGYNASQLFGNMTRGMAVAHAQKLCQGISGEPVTVREAVRITAFLKRKEREVDIWEVTCSSETRDFHLRMSALNGRLFGLNITNRVKEENATALPDKVLQQAARQHLRRICRKDGVLRFATTSSNDDPIDGLTQTFNYREALANKTERFVSVTVDKYSGQARGLWYPVGIE